MKKISRASHGTLKELNITPLLDLVFVLLVIFIISTPQLVNNLEMALPSGQPLPPPDPKAPPPPIERISIDDRGQVRLNQALVTIAALRQSLLETKARDPEFGVVVKGADEVAYQHMIDVLDVLRQLDISKIGLATEEESDAPR